MKQTNAWMVLGLAATVAATVLAPISASADSRQSNKNQWRNLGAAGAAVAGYGLIKHDRNATLLGAAGAAYSANRYEQDRHSQSQAQARRDQRARYHRYYGHRTHRRYR
jgi:hypothetical protein